MSSLETTSFLQTTQQLAGIESINTTRLVKLRSSQADINFSPVQKTWVMPKINKRSYLQQRIGVQSLRIWHTFMSVPKDIELLLKDGTLVPIFRGNWTENTLADYLTTKFETLSPGTTVEYDPYMLVFRFCPAVDIDKDGSANPYLGFSSTEDTLGTQISTFPPFKLKGPQCINVWTNFTMNNIPVSQYLACIPVGTTYGNHIFYSNYNNSESTLCLESDITHICVTLKDEDGKQLQSFDELEWELVLAMTSTIPEGFSPLEV